jgi:hypothetical protein
MEPPSYFPRPTPVATLLKCLSSGDAYRITLPPGNREI